MQYVYDIEFLSKTYSMSLSFKGCTYSVVIWYSVLKKKNKIKRSKTTPFSKLQQKSNNPNPIKNPKTTMTGETLLLQNKLMVLVYIN